MPIYVGTSEVSRVRRAGAAQLSKVYLGSALVHGPPDIPIIIDPGHLTLAEGASGTIRIKYASLAGIGAGGSYGWRSVHVRVAPDDRDKISITGDFTGGITDNAEIGQGGALWFDVYNWQTYKTITVTAKQDVDADDESAEINVWLYPPSPSTPVADLVALAIIIPVIISVTDDD